MRRIYHYTSQAQHLPQILDSGALIGRADFENEKPLVWFSLNPNWEPTATKPVREHGVLTQLTPSEYRRRFGMARLSLPADDPRLMDWRAACKYAGIPTRDRKAMEAVGKQAGGNPKHWFAAPGPISLSELKVEILDGKAWRGQA
ncbi:hypothetical protein [Marinobacter sp. W-8]|uniref:hypothetical protein n=1 Tax=Marinobacter sp. W-8 TaxID=3369658 RepID=UPI0037C9201D